MAAAEHAKRDGHAGVNGQRLEATEILVDPVGIEPDVFVRNFKHAGVHLPHDTDQLADLVPGRETARHRLAIRGLVVVGARGGKANGTRPNRIAHFPLHRFQVIGRGGVGERPLPHHVGAQRGMANIGGVVDALGQALDRIQVFGIGCPTPLDASLHRLGGDVLRALKIAHHQKLILLATGRQREAAVAHHYTGDAVPAGAGTQGIPEHLRVHMGMGIDETWCHDMAVGVEDLLGAVANFADGSNLAVDNAHVSAKAGEPRAIDDSAIFNHEIVLHHSSFSVPLRRTSR